MIHGVIPKPAINDIPSIKPKKYRRFSIYLVPLLTSWHRNSATEITGRAIEQYSANTYWASSYTTYTWKLRAGSDDG
jgi:hypothetical protein